MRVAVTGRSGQLVTSLVERARALEGVEVVPLGRPALDMERPATIAAAIEAAAPDAVINAAAYTAVDQAEADAERAMAVNGAAAGIVATAALALGVPVIQVSTDYVFDGSSDVPYREEAPVAPLGAYGWTKLAGEAAVRAANPDHLIVRTAWVYSPFGHNFVRTMLRLAETRDEVSVVADQLGTPTSALDLADGLLAALRARVRGREHWGRTFHLAGTGETNWAGLAESIFEAAAEHNLPTARVNPIATADYPTPARRPANSRLDGGTFARAFGYRAPAWRDSVRATVARIAGER